MTKKMYELGRDEGDRMQPSSLGVVDGWIEQVRRLAMRLADHYSMVNVLNRRIDEL
jgi:hypothetical protein